MMASGAFLDGLEAAFENCTVSDLVLDIQKGEEQQEPPILNYEISEEPAGESEAAKFAKDYSRSQQV